MIKSRNSSMSFRNILVTILLILCYALVNGSRYGGNGVESTIRYDLQEEGEIQGRSFRRYVAVVDNESGLPLTTNQWIKALQRGNVTWLDQLLTDVPYKAYYFETKSMTNTSALKHPFEFVLVDAPRLAKRKPRFRSFEKPCQLLAAGDGNGNSSNSNNSYGCVFPNLSGDALLIVPKPQVNVKDEGYTHLANFIRMAPTEQVEAFWKLVGTSYQRSLSGPDDEMIWLSTAGNGVPWLHFRLDKTPKYYRYAPYKTQVTEIDNEGEL